MNFLKIHLLIIPLALCVQELPAQQWEVFNSANTGLPLTGSPLSKITYMDLDTAGHPIFTLRDSGFAFFNGATWSYIRGPFPRHHDVVEQDRNGHLWTGYGMQFYPKKLARYDGSTWTVYDSTTIPLAGSSYKDINDIEMDPTGKIWFVGDDGFLLTYDGTNWYRYPDTLIYFDDYRDLEFDTSGNAIIGTGALFMHDGVNWVEEIPSTGNPWVRTMNISVDPKTNAIWGAGGIGVRVFKNGIWTYFDTSNSNLPSGQNLYHVYRDIGIDAQGDVWVTSRYFGLARYDGLQWTMIDSTNSGLPQSEFLDLIIDVDQNLWISAGDGDSLVRISVHPDSLVWPGDANDDGLADNTDLLSLGLAYGQTGRARPGAATRWHGQLSEPWAYQTPGNVNARHADCNGDGLINAADTSAILANYGLATPKSIDRGTPTDPPLRITFDALSYQPGETVTGTIHLGASANPVNNFYGLAFSLHYPTVLIDSGSFRVTWPQSWLGANTLTLAKDLPQAGRIDVARVGTDQQGVNGQGEVARFRFRLKAHLPATDPLTLTAAGIRAITPSVQPVPLYGGADTATVTTGIAQPDERLDDLRIYPSPARDQLIIETGGPALQGARLLQLDGRLLINRQAEKATGHHRMVLELAHVPAGIYLLELQTTEGERSSRKVQVE